MNLGQAFVGISTDAKDLDKGLAEAQAHVSNAVLGMKKDIESIASSFSFVGSAARAIVGAYGLKEVLGIGESYETSIIKMRYTYTENTEAMIAQAKRMSQESGNFFSFPEIADTMLKTKDLTTEMGLSQTQYLEGLSRATRSSGRKRARSRIRDAPYRKSRNGRKAGRYPAWSRRFGSIHAIYRL